MATWTSEDAIRAIVQMGREFNYSDRFIQFALAVAYGESNMNPYAVGDNGQSYGIFQFYRNGGRGTGISIDVLQNPYYEARVDLPYLYAAYQHAGGDSGWSANPTEFMYQAWTKGQGADQGFVIANTPGALAGLNDLMATHPDLMDWTSLPAQQTSGWQDNAALTWPIQDSPYITEPWGYDPNYPGAGDFHYGVDFGTNQHSVAVFTPLSGTILSVGLDNGYGLAIRVQNSDGTIGLFGHLSSSSVEEGDQVGVNQQIAMSGGGNGDWRDGTSTGWHLHFAVMRDGAWVDPMAWLNATNPDSLPVTNPDTTPQAQPDTQPFAYTPIPFDSPFDSFIPDQSFNDPLQSILADLTSGFDPLDDPMETPDPLETILPSDPLDDALKQLGLVTNAYSRTDAIPTRLRWG